jgi:3-oxoadipate enol-lactonase
MPLFDSNTSGTYYEFNVDAGADAPVLMFSNSLGTTLDMWRPQVQALSSTFRVLTYDTRGHGQNSAPPGPYSLDDLGADVLTLLDHLQLQQVHFCGLSLGGFVTQWLAVNAPERLLSATICNIAPVTASPVFWHDRAGLVLREGMRAIADGVIARFFSPQFAEASPAAVRAVHDGLLHTPAVGYAGACAAIEHADFREQLPSVHVPTLVIGGALDQAAPPDAVREVATLIPDARYVEISAAHISNIENAPEFNAALAEFLQSVSSS